MTRVAALYDVHANPPALDAVLAEVPDEARIVVGGDVVGGPWPHEAVNRLRELGDRALWLRGNAERDVKGWSREQLDGETLDFLGTLPETQVVDVDGLGPTLFCHGSPRSDEEMITAITSDDRLRTIVAGVEERTVVCGHTHHQFDRRVDEIRVLNAGSVGMPYEGRAGAYWALLGPGVELRRTEYDVEAMLAALRQTDYPDQDQHVEWLLNDIPTAQAVAEYFEQQALEAGAS